MHRQRMPLSIGVGRDLEQVAKLGRGTFTPLEIGMERTLLAVEPHADRWRVSLLGEPVETHDHKIMAIETATTLARSRHHATGERTGVCVHVRPHNLVLIGMHG